MSNLSFLTYGYRAWQHSFSSKMQDITPVVIGYCKCIPNEVGIVPVRNYTLIHQIHTGKTLYVLNGQKYHLQAGQCFITPPNVSAYTMADKEDPCICSWIGFSGSLAPHFWNLPFVFPSDELLFPHLDNLQQPSDNFEYEVAADILALYIKLAHQENSLPSSSHVHVQAAIDYLHQNYMNNPTIEEIAAHVGICHNWLSTIFKAQTGTSVQTHLQMLRLHQAEEYLSKGYSITEIARLCGYHSIANFSRQFKRYKGLSPTQWKVGLKDRIRDRRI